MDLMTSGKRRILVAAAMAASLTPALWALQNHPTATDEQSVAAAVRAMYAALSTQDWPAFKETLFEHASVSRVLVKGPSSAEIQTYSVDEFIELHKRIFSDGRTFRQQMDTAEVKVSHNVAQVWSGFRISTEEDDPAMTGFDSFTLYKVDGQWKIMSVATQRGRE